MTISRKQLGYVLSSIAGVLCVAEIVLMWGAAFYIERFAPHTREWRHLRNVVDGAWLMCGPTSIVIGFVGALIKPQVLTTVIALLCLFVFFACGLLELV